MIVDYIARPNPLEFDYSIAHRAFVDGVEIFGVFYADDEAGIVRTYDVNGNYSRDPNSQEFRTNFDGLPANPEWETTKDGVYFKTIRGKVEIKPWE